LADRTISDLIAAISLSLRAAPRGVVLVLVFFVIALTLGTIELLFRSRTVTLKKNNMINWMKWAEENWYGQTCEDHAFEA
jgi:hypothetical protein